MAAPQSNHAGTVAAIPPTTATNGHDNNQQTTGGWATYASTAFRLLLFATLFGLFKGKDNRTAPSTNAPTTANFGQTSTPNLQEHLPKAPLWRFGTPLSLSVYVAESPNAPSFQTSELVWTANDLLYGDWDDERRASIKIPLSEEVRTKNATLWAHMYLTKKGASPNPSDTKYANKDLVYTKHLLTKLRPKKKPAPIRKRLVGQDLAESAIKDVPAQGGDSLDGKAAPGELVSHWVKNMTINLITTNENVVLNNYPHAKNVIPLDFAVESGNPSASYRPPLYVNEFWVLEEHLLPINSTTKEMFMDIYMYPLSLLKLQMYMQFTEQFENQSAMMGSSQIDEFKRMMIETNPYLLGITFFISLLHSIFDFLAFKNDIAFWKGKENMAGLSVRSMVLDLFMQAVIFLYLLDNNANTSWVIVISAGVGLAIEAWKVKKAINISIVPAPGTIVGYKIKFEDQESYVKSQTKEFDEEAFRYLQYVAYPLMACYAIYSVMYEEHKGWYSYLLNTIVGFTYMFGFLRMTPQLFVNYKLQSVAHMPWRTMVYKSLNTFIDDLFAFVIKAPLLHRLACFRDDIIFLVYLYQKYKYRVDPTRANEFGQICSQPSDTVEPSEKLDATETEPVETKKGK